MSTLAWPDAPLVPAEVPGLPLGETLERARGVIRQEAAAVAALEARIGDDFAGAVEAILAGSGRVIVSGVGKSGIIARKIAATLTSTGTPATFLHPVEAMHGDLGIVARKIAATLTSTGTPAAFLHPVEALHGDLGIVGPGDVAILLSKSGESEELRGLVEFLVRGGVTIVALTGRTDSTLARHATLVLDAGVGEEACPHDLAPTTSTTAALALGDALAVALLQQRGFGRDDFARLHPGGSLGKRLLLRVRDVMITGDVPTLPPEASMRECVVLLAEKRGTVAVVDADGVLLGVVTSGDLTRLMEREEHFFPIPLRDVMVRHPKLARTEELGSAVVYRMERHGIMAMPVVDEAQALVGVVHLHDLMRAGAA